nr:MAG TPA: hypothetical protein [Caudoviricetes sp.]
MVDMVDSIIGFVCYVIHIFFCQRLSKIIECFHNNHLPSR